MRIGVDLDHTIYGFPEFFLAFVEAMTAAGHTFHITSNHTKDKWEHEDIERLRGLGFDPAVFDTSMMPSEVVRGPDLERRQKHKAPVADMLDIVFDDHADIINPYCKTPVFKPPAKKAADRKRK